MALFGRNLFWGGSKDGSDGFEKPKRRLPTWVGRVLFLVGGLWILYEGFAH